MSETPKLNEDIDGEGSDDPLASDGQDAANTEDDETDAETPEQPAGDEPSPADKEIEETEVHLSEDDLGGDDLFDGIEDSTEERAEEDSADGGRDGDDGTTADGLSGSSAAMEGAINDGAARLAVVGLTEEDFTDSNLDKHSLEAEFRETFEAFRLGYFGSRAVDEYILTPDDDEVDPAWGFCGAMLLAGAMAVWMRPDGEEKLGDVQQTIEQLTGELT